MLTPSMLSVRYFHKQLRSGESLTILVTYDHLLVTDLEHLTVVISLECYKQFCSEHYSNWLLEVCERLERQVV